MKLLVLIFSMAFTVAGFGQDNEHFVDCEKGLAYYKKDSTLVNGPIKDFHRSGKLKNLKTYDNGKILLSKFWDKKGRITDSIVYLNSVFSYQYYKFRKSGILKHRIDYVTKYNEKGDKILVDVFYERFDDEGIKVWESKTIDSTIVSKKFINGVVIEETIFNSKGMLPTGIIKYFKDDGSLERTEEYLKGNQHGITKLYAADGFLLEEQMYKKGSFVNPSTKYDRKGNKFEVTYFVRAGKPEREKKRKKIE